MFLEMKACHPVVLFLREGSVRVADAGSDEFGHAAFDQFLCQFGIFQLVTYRYAQSCTHQFG